MSATFAVDSRSENFLKSLGARHKYTNDWELEFLKDGWDAENLGRSEIKVDEAVQEYRALMDQGSPAPAPIVWLDPKIDKYIVLDGVQRLLAAELRKPKKLSVYVVKTDSEALVRKIRVFANLRLQGGHQESAEWTLERAVELLVVPGLASVEEVADMGGWTIALVRDKKYVLDLRKVIERIGGPRLPDTFLRMLSRHADLNDMEKAPKVVADFLCDLKHMKLSAEAADPYVEQFFNLPRSRVKVYEKFHQKLKDFRSDEEVAMRLADPARMKQQAMTMDGRIYKALKGTMTVVQEAQRSSEKLPRLGECICMNSQIQKLLTRLSKDKSRR